MSDKTFVMVALLYWAGWAIFAIWKMLPNSKGDTAASVMKDIAEEYPEVSPVLAYSVMIVVYLVSCLLWPFWTITRPFRKKEES